MGKLNALAFQRAKAPGRYHDGEGLMLLVKPSGTRTWLVRIQVDGRRREFGLGRASEIGLAEARERAIETRKQFRSGIDPAAAKKRSASLKTAPPTFRTAAIAAHAEYRRDWKNPKHRAQWLSSLEAYAFPAIGNMLVQEVEASHITELLRPIWLTKPETARRVRQRVVTVLDWAHVKGLRASEAPQRSISKGLRRQPKKDRHFAALDFERVGDLMVNLSKASSSSRLALQFLILTAARSGEVRGLTWEEIDPAAAVWTVPAERMKAGREHKVPLSPAALQVLSVARRARTGRVGEIVFPGIRGGKLSDMTLLKLLHSEIGGKATVHGFRSSFRDWAAEETAHQGDVVEVALAHTIKNKIEAAYRRTDYLEKRRVLMNDWAAYIGAQTPRP